MELEQLKVMMGRPGLLQACAAAAGPHVRCSLTQRIFRHQLPPLSRAGVRLCAAPGGSVPAIGACHQERTFAKSSVPCPVRLVATGRAAVGAAEPADASTLFDPSREL